MTPPRCRQYEQYKQVRNRFPLGQGDFGDDSPKVPANMKNKAEYKINFPLSQGDFGDDSPKVPASYIDTTEI
jgi:hypothetical protein